MKRIAFLGPEFTVSHEAAQYFVADAAVELVPCRMISEVFTSTTSGETQWSVIPIENTIEGSVSLHVDWLVNEVDLPIQAEWVYPSRQNLIGLDMTAIRKVYSHPVAIAQCRQFFKERKMDVEFEHASSTAESIRFVKQLADPTVAAIGTKLAAENYGMSILAENIQDHSNNYTRFILIGRERYDAVPSELWKTTILVTLPEDYPGALHQVLSAFAWRRINLSRIESRPTKKQLGSYYFYVDIEGSLDSVLLPAAISEIEAIGCQVRILGSYPSYPYDSLHSEV